MTTPADEMRQAAATLCETAGAAAEGWDDVTGGVARTWSDGCGQPDAAYIATMHPGVGLALAELLDVAASHEPVRTAPHKEPYACTRCGVADGGYPCDVVFYALDVARAINGGQS